MEYEAQFLPEEHAGAGAGAPARTHMEQALETGDAITSAIANMIIAISTSYIWIISLYLSFKINNGFHFGSFLAALCCPHFYIIYAIAVHGPKIMK